MIWCGECGYKGKGLYLENEVYCPYCKSTGNDIVLLPIDNNTRNLTDEDVQPVDFVQNEVLNYLFNKEREAESMPYSDIRQERIATLREVIRYVEGIGDAE